MHDDILLDSNGDLKLDAEGGIILTQSIRQAVLVRLRWFLSEWRFAPDFGVPWFEEIFVKNPSDQYIQQIIREECLAVDGVVDVRDINLTVDILTREVVTKLTIVMSEQTYTEEVKFIL